MKRPDDPQARAQAVGDLMYPEDNTARSLGIQIVSIAPGRATLRMTVRPEMTNGHGICHGGYIFTLADTTFAYACNSHGQRAVAASAQIDFLAPGQRGDVLTAEGVEQQVAGRTGVYDIRVTRADGSTIALFRGKSATIKGTFFDDGAEPAPPS